MPRTFEVAFESPASVERVHAAFGEHRYWVARLAAFGGSKTLESLAVDADGVVRVVVGEDLRHGALPGILTKFYRRDLNIVSTEVWTPDGSGRVTGQITVTVIGAPGSGSGAAQLTRAGDGSRLDLTGTVEFRVPLVGGTVEGFLAREFARGIPEIQRFTTAWLAEHG